MPHVRTIATAVLLAMYGVPGQAGASDASDPGLSERIERALRDMMQGMQPTLDQALDYMQSLGAIDDPRHYEMPEILPNGDIIIRRRDDAPEFRPEPPDEPRDALPDEPRDALPDDPDAPPGENPRAEPEEGIRT